MDGLIVAEDAIVKHGPHVQLLYANGTACTRGQEEEGKAASQNVPNSSGNQAQFPAGQSNLGSVSAFDSRSIASCESAGRVGREEEGERRRQG